MEAQNSEVPQPELNQVSKIRALVIVVLGLILLAFGISSGAYYLKGSPDKTGNQAPQDAQTMTNPAQTAPTAELSDELLAKRTQDWKTFTSNSRGITLKHPPGWKPSNDQFISEEQFTPGLQDRSKVYNVIEIQKFPEQLYPQYSNSDWFNLLFNSTSALVDQKETIMKIASGITAGGDRYVIYSSEPSGTARTDIYKQVKVHILRDQTIYQLSLDMYDQYGVDVLRMMVAGAVIK